MTRKAADPGTYRRSHATVVIAGAGLVLLAAACSGKPSAAGGFSNEDASTGSASAVAYSACMRSHGVPNWPDPSIDSRGRPVFAMSISRVGFDPYSRLVWAMGNACSHLMPDLPGLPAAVSP